MVDKIDDLEKYAEQENVVENIQTIKKDIIDKSSDAIEQDLDFDLSWLDSRYREVTGTSRKDVKLGEVEDFRKFIADNPVAEKIFQRLKDSGLKVYINDKTDLSFTHEFSIIMGMSDSVTEESKYTMNLDKNAIAQDVQKRKFIHEMCHSIVVFCKDEREKLRTNCWGYREAFGINITKLGNLPRYQTSKEIAKEDATELLRMYIQDPDDFKKYLGQVFHDSRAEDIFYQMTEDCINRVIN